MTNVAHGSNDSCVACNMANGYKNQFPFWKNIENLILKKPFFCSLLCWTKINRFFLYESVSQSDIERNKLMEKSI